MFSLFGVASLREMDIRKRRAEFRATATWRNAYAMSSRVDWMRSINLPKCYKDSAKQQCICTIAIEKHGGHWLSANG